MSSTNWVTVIVAGLGIIGTLASGPTTQWLSRKSEKTRLLRSEARSALLDFVAASGALVKSSKADAAAVHDLARDVYLASAAVQLSCSPAVAKLTNSLSFTAGRIEMSVDLHNDTTDEGAELAELHWKVISQARLELGLTELV